MKDAEPERKGFPIYRYEIVDKFNSVSLADSEYLYHYTTLQGCLGILESKSLWASDARCLNDELELVYGIDLICDELLTKAMDGINRQTLEMEARNIRSYPRSVYIASFSTDGDQLGQWRAYGGNGGVNIGLRFGKLASKTRSVFSILAPVIYDVERQRTLVGALIAEFIERYRSQSIGHGSERKESIGVNFVVNAMLLAAFLKHPKFAEEREWRLAVNFAEYSKVKFRASDSMIIPYWPVELDFAMDHCADLCITVGPMPHAGLVKDMVVEMLKRAHSAGDRANVLTSGVPYRNW